VLLRRGGPGWFGPVWARLGPRRAWLASAVAAAVGCAVWPLFGPFWALPLLGPWLWAVFWGPFVGPPLFLCAYVSRPSSEVGSRFLCFSFLKTLSFNFSFFSEGFVFGIKLSWVYRNLGFVRL
jgi:hypothetical protein